MAMATMANRRKDSKPRVLWVGKDGEQAIPIATPSGKFIEINWRILRRWLIITLVVIGIFSCGFVSGATWMWGG